MIVFGHDKAIASWVCDRIEVPTPLNAAALGATVNGELVAGVAYINYRGCDIEMLCASDDPRWLSRSHLRAFFGYPFNQLGCLRVTAIIAKRNKRARKMVERLGFKREGAHPKALDGHTAITYGMLKEDCRWIGDTNGQEKRTDAAASA